MLRKEKRTYRFSEKVEKELKELGFQIQIEKRKYGNCQYANDNNLIFVYSEKEYPTIDLSCYISKHYPSLQEFSKKVEELKNLVFKIHEIVMQDYQDEEEER